MITTLVFDIGNVLSHFSFDRIVDGASCHTALDKQAIKDVVIRWSHPFCLGDLDAAAFANHCLEDLQFTGSTEDLKRAYNSGFEPNQVIRSVIEHHAKDYRLLYLSDTNAWHLEHLLEHDPLLPFFEGGTVSFQARSLKPDPAIYEYAAKAHGFPPSEAIFIDDKSANVAGAEAVGFTGLCYEANRHEAFEEQLAARLRP